MTEITQLNFGSASKGPVPAGCIALVADTSLSGSRLGRELEAAIAQRRPPHDDRQGQWDRARHHGHRLTYLSRPSKGPRRAKQVFSAADCGIRVKQVNSAIETEMMRASRQVSPKAKD
jgi:hypothetical protein